MKPDSPLAEHHRGQAEALSKRGSEATASHRPGAATGTVGAVEVEYIDWGPGEGDGPCCRMLATTGSVELEYAALRRGCGLVDAANRGTMIMTGQDRLDLLDRLVTQKVGDLPPGATAAAFMLERTGRIMADLLLVMLEDRVIVDVDVHDVARVTNAVHAMVFAEDVEVHPDEGLWYRLEARGPACSTLLNACGVPMPEVGHVASGAIGGVDVQVIRDDLSELPGVVLVVATEHVEGVWLALHAAGAALDRPVRTVGWYAHNMVRVEAGSPRWNVDVGPTNLPHETGVLGSRVSFTKGCYPGQEVVARMEHLGHPKQILRRLVLPDGRMPVAGAQVYASADDIPGQPCGVVTSSAPAPVKGGSRALAMLRWASADPSSSVTVFCEGDTVEAIVEVVE